ncbi:MAG: VWA domain-containing protein [Rickettsiaceae bacterium]|nr:VWA domain-containing protein [Rickettsiaceae bacterium]
MFIFYWPWMILLLPMPLLAWFFLPKANNENTESTPEIIFPQITRLQQAFKAKAAPGKNKNHFFIIILTLIWCCLTLALMRPQLVDQYSQIKNKGYDLMLAVDTSLSMEALDFSTKNNRVNRLDVTKEVVSEFVSQRRGDRVGLVLFGQYAYLHVPMTLDTMSVATMLNNVVNGMAGYSTSIGDAIGIAVKNLRQFPGHSKVIILLTDGEDNSSNIPPLEAAKIAASYGIRIYTIGIGKQGLVPIPNAFGIISMQKVTMDEELLKEIAKITGGKSYLATNKEGLSQIYQEINKLEKTELEIKEYVVRTPLYRYPLVVVACLLLLLAIMPLIRRRVYGI